MYTLLSIKTDIRFEISAPDLPRTHKMMSNLPAVRREPETRKPATGATCSLFKSIHFLYEKVTLIFQCRIRNSICNCNLLAPPQFVMVCLLVHPSVILWSDCVFNSTDIMLR